MLPVGKLDMEYCSPTGSIIKTNIAIEPSNDFLYDTKTQAGARLFWTGICRISLREFLEDMRLKIFRNSATVVSHLDANGLLAFLGHEDYFPAWRREFGRVRK